MTAALNIDLSQFKVDIAVETAKRDDPVKFFLDEMGDLSGVDIFHNNVLVRTYERPSVTKGGILITDKAKMEDVWQGVVGLVLKAGPLAFVDDDRNKFMGCTVKPGDWVFYRTADTSRVHIKGKECRLVQDSNIRGTVTDPNMVY